MCSVNHWSLCLRYLQHCHYCCCPSILLCVFLYCGRDHIVLCMLPANGRRCYIVKSSLIGWVHTQNDPWCAMGGAARFLVVHTISRVTVKTMGLTHWGLVIPYIRLWTGSSFVQVMACCLFNIKPLLEPMLIYNQLGKFHWNLNQNRKFLPRKCISKCSLQNGSHFIQTSMCSGWIKMEQYLSQLKHWPVWYMGWTNTNFLWVWPFGLSLCFSVHRVWMAMIELSCILHLLKLSISLFYWVCYCGLLLCFSIGI